MAAKGGVIKSDTFSNGMARKALWVFCVHLGVTLAIMMLSSTLGLGDVISPAIDLFKACLPVYGVWIGGNYVKAGYENGQRFKYDKSAAKESSLAEAATPPAAGQNG